ncbi:MAG TPA: ABC transporter permease [Chitinophagaceae bacterium]|jgi:ABC-2 type transport system permease protein|nr:ABC transporter permease [Chitinophagaceae bacterium]HMU57980.1 ABC transporter permease [Chitinophagaceae bacterium]
MKPTMQQYSQSKALWAITKASFRAIFENPSAIIFSILFPIIFVLIFGAFGNGGGLTYRIALESKIPVTDTFYNGLLQIPGLKVVEYADTVERREDMIKGRLTAILDIQKKTDTAGKTKYTVAVRTTTASSNTIYSFLPSLELVKLKLEKLLSNNTEDLVVVSQPNIETVRKYRAIDFILPGQLGFSILFSTLFGIAFTFFGLREQLVLKRFYATPVNRINILMGIGFSRLAFQVLSVIVLILFGHFAMKFTLIHGAFTFLQILLLTLVMLFFLMGVGLIFSSVVKTDSSIPLLINIFALPQMMLSGTFFTFEVFPGWLQEVCKVLPLTQYNDAVRKVSFEGLTVLNCWKEIGILGIWIAIAYVIAVKVIKWE